MALTVDPPTSIRASSMMSVRRTGPFPLGPVFVSIELKSGDMRRINQDRRSTEMDRGSPARAYRFLIPGLVEIPDYSSSRLRPTICSGEPLLGSQKAGYTAASPRQCGCPHWQEISVLSAREAQCGLQYFSLSGGTQLQAGLAHFFVSVIEISLVPLGALGPWMLIARSRLGLVSTRSFELGAG